jgi:DNA polymerase
MIQAVIDYESRSEIELKGTSAIEYAKHPSTSVMCLGYKINDGPPMLWLPERSPMPDDLWDVFKNGTLVAHNAGFERAITRHTLTRYKTLTDEQVRHIQQLTPDRWRCSAAKAAASSLPRDLKTVCKVLGLKAQKDTIGHKLMLKYSKPRRPSKKNPDLYWDDKKEIRAIYRYCLMDVEAEFEVDQALPDLTKDEQKVWELDQIVNDRGVMIDIPTVKTILEMIKEEMDNITDKVVELSSGTLYAATQTAKVLNWLNKRGANIQNLQAQTIRDKLLEENLHPYVRQMLEYRQWSSKTSTAKYASMIKAVGEDDRARELLLYHAAIPTGRAGGKRVQPQNFPRPTIKNFNSDEAIELIKSGGLPAIRRKYGDNKVMDVLASAIRGMLIASPGKELFCADFASVEARLAFWVAEHEDGLQAYRDNRKLYEEMASAIFNMPIENVTKDSLERFVAKESVLGCQYGLGPKKFLFHCHKKGMKSVTEEIAEKAVYSYRRVHHPVPTLWKNLELSVIEAVLQPGVKLNHNKVVIYVKGDWLNIKLPSGRRLRYYKPRISNKQLARGRLVPQINYWTIELHQWVEVVAWGGVFTNHIVQGIARDLMMNGAMNIENAGYEFLLSVHDEALSERKIGEGNLKEYISLMTKLPPWAEGAPITAEGWVGKRYRK